MQNYTTQQSQYEIEQNKHLPNHRLLWAILLYIGAFFILPLLVGLIVQLFYIGVYNGFKPIEEGHARYNDYILFYSSVTNLIIYILAAVILIVWLLPFLKEDWQKTRKRFFKTLLLGLGGWFILIGMVFLASQLEASIRTALKIPTDVTPGNQQHIIEMFKSKYIGLILIVTLLGAPIVEELVFRKSMFGFLKNKFKLEPIFLIIISGVLFGLIHIISPLLTALFDENYLNLVNELINLISYSFMGMAIGIVYFISNENIYAPMVTHFTQNLISSIGQIILIMFPELLEQVSLFIK